MKVVDVCFLAMNPGPWALGSSAASTMLTAVAVAVALFVAVRDTLRVSRLQAREAQGRRRAQDSQIAAWATSQPKFQGVPRANITGNPWYAEAHVLNNSSSPISDVEVELGHLNIAGKWEGFREFELRAVLPPGERIDFSSTKESVHSLSDPRHNVLMCKSTFRDNAGVRWQRDGFNNLTEIPRS
jgi:hypothetical protein